MWWSKSDARLLEGLLALGIVLVGVFGVAAPLLGTAAPGCAPSARAARSCTSRPS